MPGARRDAQGRRIEDSTWGEARGEAKGAGPPKKGLATTLVSVQPGPDAPSHFSIRTCSPLVELNLVRVEGEITEPKLNAASLTGRWAN